MTTLFVENYNNFQKTIGLIGKKNPQAIFFKTRWGIHTFGVRFPIDIVILDMTNTVQKIKHSLKPNRIFLWNPKFYNVIELPEGTIEKEHIKIGEILDIRC